MISPWKPPFIDDVPTKISIIHDFPIFYPPFFQGIVPFKTTISKDFPLENHHFCWSQLVALDLVTPRRFGFEVGHPLRDLPRGHPMTSTKQIPRGIPTSVF